MNEAVDPRQPLGDEEGYVVRADDCLASIAEKFGFFWETLWDHPRNAELKRVRRDPNILLRGDRVFVPDLQPKKEDAAVDRVHRYKRRGVPEILRLQFLDEQDAPRAGVSYRFEIDGEVRTGTLDGEGYLQQWVPPRARDARLELEPEDEATSRGPEVYELDIGRLQPAETPGGAAARMQSLGFYSPGQSFHHALEAFQIFHELDATARLDDDTVDLLRELYGS